MTDVVQKLWGFCHTLRHDGVDYGDYIEQITYLLFLKMADERAIDLRAVKVERAGGKLENVDCSWPTLRDKSGTELLDHYVETLRALGKSPGILGDIYAGAQSRFNNPVNLKRLVGLIDETEWTTLGVDVKAAAYEGLLEKAASEGKKGAGQYFTPRVLIDAIVRCTKPDPRTHREFTVCDPACGTGGFLVAAYEWLIDATTGGALDRETALRVKKQTYFGSDLVPRPRRLALMNLYLHGIEPHIALGDSIYEPASSQRFDLVLTNPPFGTKGANQAPARDDFTIETSNKQLNFLQHVLTILKAGGRAAVVLPDNCLFADQAGEVFEIVTQDCELHTVLRLPRGTFTPYSPGVKANVVFFTKGARTETRHCPVEAIFASYLIRLRLLPPIPSEFVFLFLNSPDYWSSIAEQAAGIAIPNINASKLTELWVPLPPLAEQQRIVAQVEALLARVNAARERLARVPAILKRFRQSVLAAACSGRLTEESREQQRNLVNAPDQKQEPDLPDIPSAWSWCRLPDLGELNRGKSRHRPRNASHLYGGPYPFIQTGDIAQSNGRITTHRQTYSEAGLAQSRLWPEGTVCITIAANIADSAILTYRACFPDSVVGFIANPTQCAGQYVELFIRTARDDLSQFEPATAQKNINLEILRDVRVPLPPLAEQHEIVRRVDALFKLADEIEQRVKAATARAEKLTQAILAKAFRGELVPTEAELARREGRDYEPAAVLLERVRAEREAQKPSPRPSPKGRGRRRAQRPRRVAAS